MKPVSPVIPNLDNPETVIAEHQDQYQNLPALVLNEGIISRWKLSPEEIEMVVKTGDIYLFVWTFGNPLQPVLLQTETPQLENPIVADDSILEASEVVE